ncbi:MAG: KpsF/GutQ family sugar-phosphate isomerase [Bacteriovoracaceae bacterium]|nr:KpsF/GutQ family sugar-phosphate isomerase [Bacteriovoracaceae bacterium]
MTYQEDAKKVIQIEIEGLQAMADRINGEFDQVIELILNSKSKVVITGMGKSGLVGKKIAATLASTGTPAFFMHPGEAYHGDLGMIAPDDVIVAISNSGETEEIIRLLSFFKDNKNSTVAMTGKSDSTLAKHCDFFLDIGVPKEACPLALAPTTSTTVTMAMGDALAVALMNARDFKEENFARFHPGGRLGRKLLVKVKDVMRKDKLPILSPNMKFDEVISVISNGFLGLGVLLNGEKIEGVITDGDIRRALQSEKGKALDLCAKDFYTASPLTIDCEEKILTADDLMQQRKITALLVEDQGSFCGILHLYDL